MMSRLLTRREQAVLGFLAFALVTGSITVFALRRSASVPAPIVVETPSREPAPASVAHAAQPLPAAAADPAPGPDPIEIVVSIQGAVRKPGVYQVDQDSRVQDLIRFAGGLNTVADVVDVNLAARLIDGTTLTIPARPGPGGWETPETIPPVNPAAYTVAGQAFVTAQGQAAGAAGAGLVHLNRATQAELETLPGIGPKLAQQIIQYRTAQPFRDVSELMDVSGIGEAKFESVRDLVTVK